MFCGPIRGEYMISAGYKCGIDHCYSSKLVDVLKNIQQAIIALPKPIRRVCYVQVFAFMGWFPFLFYA